MASTAHLVYPRDEPMRRTLAADLRHALAVLVRRRRERRIIVSLARHSPRVLRDMGFDPESIYAALDGTWDEVDRTAFPPV